MKEHVLNSLTEAQSGLDSLIHNEHALLAITKAAELLIDTIKNGGRIYSCGNGGSMCDAMHFAEELSGRYRLNRRGLPASSISDPSHISCVGNDYGYDQIFSRYLEAHAKPNDCLLAISTSGKSPNIIKAAEYAKSENINVISLTGKTGTLLTPLSHIEICTPAGHFADRVQELHIKVIHILIELVERSFFPDNYIDGSE